VVGPSSDLFNGTLSDFFGGTLLLSGCMGGKSESTVDVSISTAEFSSEHFLDPNKTTEELVWPCRCGFLGRYQ